MSLRKLNLIVLATLLVISMAAGCKKDEDVKTLPYLNGILSANVPEYARVGQTVTLTPKGLEHPEGEEIGYRWKVVPSMSQYDTTDVFSFTFSDTLQTCTIYCYGFAEGYNSSSYSYSTTVVNGGLNGSLQGLDITEDTPNIEMPDGSIYYYTTAGDRQWFINNLADTDAGGAPYKNYGVMSDIFGRYYSYVEALEACPSGWSLPTEDDWMALAEEFGEVPAEKYQTIGGIASKLMANARFNGNDMWEYWPAVGEITNSSRLSLIPTGYSNLGNKRGNGYIYADFSGLNLFSAIWTADKVEGEGDMAYYRYLIADQPDLFIGKGDVNSFGASVRCVRKLP